MGHELCVLYMVMRVRGEYEEEEEARGRQAGQYIDPYYNVHFLESFESMAVV